MEASVSGSTQSRSPRHPMSYLTESRPAQTNRAGFPQRYKTYGADRNDQMAKGLGWFSIGLGIAQLLAPRAISRAIGLDGEHAALMRALGLREIASGVAIVTQREPAPWLWTRVAGDAMDLTLLSIAASRPGADRNRVNAATVAVTGVTMLDVLTSVQQTDMDRARDVRDFAGNVANRISAATTPAMVKVSKAMAITRSPEECYQFWHDFENFPRFMKHVQEVRREDDNRWHWTARGPAGTSFEWDAEITQEEPGRAISWRSLEGADVQNIGSVRFEAAPGGRGTIVRAEIEYSPPGGKAGMMIARLFGEEPSQQIEEDLRRFKQLIETGEIPTTVGQSSGRRDPLSRLLFRKGKPG